MLCAVTVKPVHCAIPQLSGLKTTYAPHTLAK